MTKVFLLVLSLTFCTLLAACNAGNETRSYTVSIGNAEHGKDLIAGYGCGACHTIPGVHGARGQVGPSLRGFGLRTMIAGELANSPENLSRWIQHPRQIEPKTAMPDLGLTPDQANDIAAYLYTLQSTEGSSWTE